MEIIGGGIANALIPFFIGHSFDDINYWIQGKRGLRAGKEHTALWRIMLDTDIIKANDLMFDTNLTLGEDTKFINQYLLYVDSVGVLEETLYYLTVRDGSANVSSNADPILMTTNKLKLINARKEIDEIAAKKKINTRKYWEGTMVLSAVQLAMKLPRNKRATQNENHKKYQEFVRNVDVEKAIRDFKPCAGFKAIPFIMIKSKFGVELLYHLCAVLPNKVISKF